MQVRAEREQDFPAIRSVLQDAFGPGSPEAALVEALRDAGAHVPELCLVAEQDGEVVGHIFFSRARIESGDEVLALAPMAVLPEIQGTGIGSELVHETLRLAGDSSFPLVVVVGHAEYYPRFGFEPAHDYGIRAPWEIPPEAWMVCRLPAYRPEARGLVQYAEPFDRVT